MRSKATNEEVDLYEPYTSGLAAEIQRVSISVTATSMDSDVFEYIMFHTPRFYYRLIQIHEFCVEHQGLNEPA